jgi:hypothetical protein
MLLAGLICVGEMEQLSGNELMAYNSGFEDGFKTGQASVAAIWILSAITNDGESLEEETTIHKTLAGVIAEISAEWKKWRVLNYDSDEDSGKKEISRLAYEEPLSLEEVTAAFKNGGKVPVVLAENKEMFDGVFKLTLQYVQLLE